VPNKPKILIKPSDASTWVSCVRRAWLDKHQSSTVEIDPFNQLLFDAGLEHEAAILAMLQTEHNVHKAHSVTHTHALMSQGVAVIYQAQLLDEEAGLIGFPDFLIRHESGQYQPADAKLSQSEHKKSIQIQLGFYRRLLANNLPAIIFLGDGRKVTLGDEINPVAENFILRMKELLTMPEQPNVRYSHSKCRICPYYSHCRPDFDAKEDLSLLYGVHGNAANHLAVAGITTITQLANSEIAAIPDVPYLKDPKRKHRAILQAKSFLTGEISQLNKVTLPEGTWIHFDIEDNPLTPTRERHVYLWGFLAPPYHKENFESVWTDDETQDYDGWLGFLDKIDAYRTQYSPLVLAHYSNHEKATIKKYAERYNMQNHPTVLWLLGNNSPLFDMQKPVLDNLVLPLQGYGLKDICKHPSLVNFQWENETSSAQWSVVQFNRFLTETNPQEKQQLKTDILGYNRDDVIATRKLEEWLRTNFI